MIDLLDLDWAPVEGPNGQPIVAHSLAAALTLAAMVSEGEELVRVVKNGTILAFAYQGRVFEPK